MTYKQHILKSLITVRSIKPVVRNFCRKSSNVRLPIIGRKFFYQSSVRKTLTFPQVFDKIFRPIFKLNVLGYLIFRSAVTVNCKLLWRVMWCSYDISKPLNISKLYSISFCFYRYKKYKNRPRNARVIIENKWHVFMAHGVHLQVPMRTTQTWSWTKSETS